MKLALEILPQPDDTTCGPTCLQAVYGYYNDVLPLTQVIREVKKMKNGGTLAVFLGCHALSRNYEATLYTYDLKIFDPTWFGGSPTDLTKKLARQKEIKKNPKLHMLSDAYLEFLNLGGKIVFRELTSSMIRGLLKKNMPVLTGLSATYLYKSARETDVDGETLYDDIKGEPSGHFVVLCGYNPLKRQAILADPLMPNPISDDAVYEVKLTRLIVAIMLGILTFDANLLVIRPCLKKKKRSKRRVNVRSRRH